MQCKQPLRKYLSILVLICIIGIATCVVLLIIPGHKKNENSVIDKPYLLDFNLIDKNGHNFDTKSLLGKPSLVYFGFTYCPDICPASLGKIVHVMEVAKKYSIDLNTVFITIDPERDTPDMLSKYVAYYSDKIITLSGNSQATASACSLFNVYYAKDDTHDNAGHEQNYMMNHSSFIYILDGQGRLVKLFAFAQSSDEIIEFLRLNFR